MKKMFLLISICFLNVVSLSADNKKDSKSYSWESTGPTAADIEASRPKGIDIALQKGDLSWVQNFVQQGGDLNARNSMGMPMLVSAAFFRHMHIVQYLVQRGADINKRSDWVKNGDERGQTALMIAAQSNHLPMVQYLVEHGADLKVTDESGDTVVTWAKNICPWPTMREYFKKLAPDSNDSQEDDF